MAWSVPYAGAQFGLVVPTRREPGIQSLADLRGKRVGIVTGTVALSEKDHAVVRFKSREELLEGFRAGALDAAFLDADFAAWYLHEHPQLELRLVTEYVPRERWNMALAVRAKDAQLLVEINRALAQLAESGELRKIYADSGVPFRPPLHGVEPATGIARHLAAHPRAGRAGRQHGPRQLALLQRQGRSTGVRRRAGASPGRAASRQAAHRMARHPARDRGRATPPASVRPGVGRGRRGQRRRRR